MSIEINGSIDNYINTNTDLSQDKKVSDVGNKNNNKVDVNDYISNLTKKFSYLNSKTSMSGIPTTVNVSSDYLKKCANDPDEAQRLEENLSAIPNCVDIGIRGCLGTVTSMSYFIDSKGNMSVAISGSSDPDGKIAKENAERKKEEEKAKRKELEEKLEELREKNKEKYEELVEKIKDGSFDDKSGEFEFKIHGTDIDSIIKQIEEKYSAGFNLSSNISSYDIKV